MQRHGARGHRHSRTQFQHTLRAASPSGTRQAFPRTCRQVLAAEQRKQRRERHRHVTRPQPANPAEKYHFRPTVSTQVLATGETIIYFKPKAANTILTIGNFPRDNQNSASSQNRVTGTRFPLTHETAKTGKIHETTVPRHWKSGVVIAEEKRPQWAPQLPQAVVSGEQKELESNALKCPTFDENYNPQTQAQHTGRLHQGPSTLKLVLR